MENAIGLVVKIDILKSTDLLNIQNLDFSRAFDNDKDINFLSGLLDLAVILLDELFSHLRSSLTIIECSNKQFERS